MINRHRFSKEVKDRKFLGKNRNCGQLQPSETAIGELRFRIRSKDMVPIGFYVKNILLDKNGRRISTTVLLEWKKIRVFCG